ncbi:MAG: GntR family transcriptional regulator [Actinomycetes bacterium]
MTVIRLGGQTSRRAARSRTGRSARTRLLYEEVIDLVDRLVAERGLGPGDMLPSQAELAELASVSLITVRRALEELERDGRVRRHQGLGTFLARPKILSDPSRAGGLGDTLGGSHDSSRVGTKVLGIARALPSSDVAAALGISASDPVWQVRRLRLIAGKPSIVETAIIPVALAPDLPDAYRDGSLYETLSARYGLDDDYEEQFLDVIHPSPDVRGLLRLTPRTLVVRIRGLSRDQTGVVFDCFEQVYPASEFAFVIAGQTERRLHQGDLARDWSVVPLPPSPNLKVAPARSGGRARTAVRGAG